jgi:hypothetical protein
MAISSKIIFEVLTQFGALLGGCWRVDVHWAAVHYINFAPNVDDLRLGGLFYNVYKVPCSVGALARAPPPEKVAHRNKISHIQQRRNAKMCRFKCFGGSSPLSYRSIFPCFIASICRVVEELYANPGASKDCKCPHPQSAHTSLSLCARVALN